MRNLFLAVLLCFSLHVSAWGAFHFVISDPDSITLADTTAIDFPDADWTVFMLVKLNSVSGWGADGRIFVWSGSGQEFSLSVDQDSGVPGAIELYIADDNFATELFASSDPPNQPFDLSTSWHTVLVERTGTTFNVEVDGTQVISSANANIDALVANQAMRFGNSNGGSNPSDMDMAEFVKFDRVFTTAEKASLNSTNAGSAGTCLNKTGMTLYVPMIAAYQELKSGIAVTNNGTTVVAHPRIVFCN